MATMTKALSGSSDIWLLPELPLENLFLADDKRELPPPELHSNDDESVPALSRRLAHSFIHKDEDFNSLLIKQNQKSPASCKCADDELYPCRSLTKHRSQVARVFGDRRTHMTKGSRPVGFFSSSSSPPVLESQPGSGMRAVFLNPRKESSGTGVFLPRQPGVLNQPKKPPACSAALLPARVVQALNLSLDELCFYPRAPSHGIGLAGNQNRSRGKKRLPWAAGSADRLPPEWTY